VRAKKTLPGRIRWLCGLCVAVTHTAHARSFDYIDSSNLQTALHPGHVLLDANGAWVTGNATARFRSDGSPVFASRTNLPGGDALLAETGDGNLVRAFIPILNTPSVLTCSVSQSKANGAVQWTRHLPTDGYCAWLGVGSDDSIWVQTVSYSGAGASLFKLGADGSGVAQIPMPADFVAGSTPVLTRANEIYLAGFARSTSANAAFIKIDTAGNVVWERQSTNDGIQLNTLGVDAAGNLHAAGSVNDGASHKLATVSLTAAGDLRWDRSYEAAGVLKDGGLAVGADGIAYALARAGDASNTTTLEKVDDAGNLVWTRELPLHGTVTFNYSTPDGHAGVRIAPNGDVLALVDDSSYATIDIITELLRYDGAGNLISTAIVTGEAAANGVGVASMTTLPDSSVLLTTTSDYRTRDIDTVASPAANAVFLHLDRAGQQIASPFAAASVVNNGIVLDQDIQTDGSTYLLTQYLTGAYHDLANGVAAADSSRYALSRISPDGHLLWKSYAQGYWSSAQVVAGSDRVCISGSRSDYALYAYGGNGPPPAGAQAHTLSECHSSTTGATLFTADLRPPDGLSSPFVFSRVLADTSLVAAFVDAAGKGNIAVLDTTGNIVQAHMLDGAGQIFGIAADGSSLFINGANGVVATVLKTDGSMRYQKDIASSLSGFFSAQILDDGAAQLIGRDTDSSIVLLALSPSGALAWTAKAFDADTAASSLLFAGTNDSDASYLALTTALDTHVLKVSRSSGAIAWSKIVTLTSNSLTLAVDPASDNLVAIGTHAHKLGIQAFDRTNGIPGALSYRACGTADCAQTQLRGGKFGADGALRVVLDASLAGNSPEDPPQLLAIDAPAQNPAAISVAQPGITGAWSAPYESGQGFVIDYIAGNNVLFIPWFTFVPDGTNDPSGLMWFTLQGSPSSNARTADLVIVANSGGVFGSGNAVAREAGTAHLSFSDCDHGTLSYQFDADVNPVPPGVVSITRLGPSTSACILSDGTQRAAENTNAPSNGFDARHSGSWFDASASGQGMEFTIVPASAGFAGLFYGAWFTYDPEDAADDAMNQHWFTLQGDLSNATNGQVTVAIVATIGGSFDDAPTNNTFRIGQAHVKFSGCATASLDYQFDDVAIAHAYRNRSGTIRLGRIGGCAD
jgi:hypothetical protein